MTSQRYPAKTQILYTSTTSEIARKKSAERKTLEKPGSGHPALLKTVFWQWGKSVALF